MLDYVLSYSLGEHKPIDIIYMKGMEITKRRIKVFKMDEEIVKAIDLEKGAIRTFKKSRILSASRINFYNNVKEKNRMSNINLQ